MYNGRIILMYFAGRWKVYKLHFTNLTFTTSQNLNLILCFLKYFVSLNTHLAFKTDFSFESNLWNYALGERFQRQ